MPSHKEHLHMPINITVSILIWRTENVFWSILQMTTIQITKKSNEYSQWVESVPWVAMFDCFLQYWFLAEKKPQVPPSRLSKDTMPICVNSFCHPEDKPSEDKGTCMIPKILLILIRTIQVWLKTTSGNGLRAVFQSQNCLLSSIWQ